jgi:hypothetical protein
VKCAIAFDSGSEPLGEIVRIMLPDEWQPHVFISTYARWADIIEMVRNASPALLAIHTNLLLMGPEDGIEGCAAVSPETQYLFLTGWSEENIEDLLKSYPSLHVSVLRMPFERAQLITALEGALT